MDGLTGQPHGATVCASATRKAQAARRKPPLAAAGFTLLESMLVTVIVGVGVLGIVAAQQAYHQQNGYGQRMGAALLLANEIRELTLALPLTDPITGNIVWGPETGETSVMTYDDLDDFDGMGGNGLIISPPIDALGQVVPDMAGWSQRVTVENVLPSFISGPAVPDNTTDVLRITCSVRFQGPADNAPREVTRLTWIRTKSP